MICSSAIAKQASQINFYFEQFYFKSVLIFKIFEQAASPNIIKLTNIKLNILTPNVVLVVVVVWVEIEQRVGAVKTIIGYNRL